MSPLTMTLAGSQQTTAAVSHQTTRLLTAGIVAGPLFLVVWALQAFTRRRFDRCRLVVETSLAVIRSAC